MGSRGSQDQYHFMPRGHEFDKYESDDPADSSHILFVNSIDGGTTWSTPLRLDEKGGDCRDDDSTVEGAVPAIGPNGEVYVAWAIRPGVGV